MSHDGSNLGPTAYCSLDDEHRGPVGAGALWRQCGGQWSTNVGRGQGLLCPPTAGGGCSFCSLSTTRPPTILQLVQGHCGDSVGVSGALMSEEAKACFALPLREAVAHFARGSTAT
jgi:hypothetical protein